MASFGCRERITTSLRPPQRRASGGHCRGKVIYGTIDREGDHLPGFYIYLNLFL